MACLRGFLFLSCWCPVTIGVVVLSLPVYRCCTVICCWHIFSCLVTISINVLSMCHCFFVAHCCQYFVPVLLFLGQYFVALASLTVTLSYLCLVAVSFWYYCHHTSVFIVRCKIDYPYWNHVENMFLPSVNWPCICTPYVQGSKKPQVIMSNKTYVCP